MSTNLSVENQSQNQTAVAAPGFEIAAQEFWQKNRAFILGVCVLALLIVAGREGWQYFAAQREDGIRAEYSRAGDRTEQLAAFAAANSGHVLAGVAYLRVADAKYAGGDFRAAADAYKKAADTLKALAFLGRARVGAGMSLVNAGDRAGGEAALKAAAADAGLLKATRAEASYHLATLAHEAGNGTEVSRLVTEIARLDSSGIWAERAANLQVAK